MIIDDRDALEIGRELAKLTSPSELPLGDLSDALLISLGKIAFRLVAPKVLEMIRANPGAIEAGRDAVLTDMRDRKLLKYLFAPDPDGRGHYGTVERPIDLETQHQLGSEVSEKVFAAMIDKMREDYGG